MSRRKSREQAFALLFEKNFNDQPVEELAVGAAEARDIEVDAFTMELAAGAEAKVEELDALIETYSHKWSKNRMSRVALAVLRLAAFEMLYVEDTPQEVAINEAVELAKRYGGEEDGSFVNGVLGGIARREK